MSNTVGLHLQCCRSFLGKQEAAKEPYHPLHHDCDHCAVNYLSPLVGLFAAAAESLANIFIDNNQYGPI